MGGLRKILYVGQLWKGGTCLDRMRALQELGCSIVEFDTTRYLTPRSRIGSLLAHRLNWGPPIKELNRDLLEFTARAVPEATHIWIDKGKWVAPETLLQLRAQTGATLVHYTLDPQLAYNQSRHFHRSIPVYDALFTTKPFEFDLYIKRGANKVFLIDQSYDSKRFFPRELSTVDLREYGSDVCFIGRPERHYRNRLRAVLEVRANTKVWGPGWEKYAKRHRWAQKCIAGDALWGEKYPLALNATKIGLGFLSKYFGETTTTRTFEIPACGTFLLAERTEDHMKLFNEGKEAEFFGSDEELLEKINFFLAHASERKRIARAGYERCIKGGYSNLHRMQQVLELIDLSLLDGNQLPRQINVLR